MHEKFGDTPLSDNEVVTLISNLSSSPGSLANEKDVKELSKSQLEDVNKAITAKRGSCFNGEIDSLLGILEKSKNDIIKEQKKFKEKQKLNAQMKVRMMSSDGQPQEFELDEEDKKDIVNEIFRTMFY